MRDYAAVAKAPEGFHCAQSDDSVLLTPELIEEYLETLQETGCTPNTLNTYRMKLTYNPEHALKFEKKQLVTLAVLFVFGCGCVVGYLTYHYDHTSLTTAYSAEEVVQMNKTMYGIITENTELTVYNTLGVPLPETGGATPYLFIYGGLFLMLSAVVTGYILRRRYGKEDLG